MTVDSAIYEGVVTHARAGPQSHRLALRIFMLLVDLDDIAGLDRRIGLFSAGRFNLVSLDPRAHGDGSRRPLKAQVEAELAAAGLEHGGPVLMLCMPRILGRAFNPLTVYFCHRPDGTLSATLYEVTNTFGERHGYLIAATVEDGVVRQSCAKGFYVSPFMDFDLDYAFRVRPPGEAVQVAIAVSGAQGPVLAASFRGRRRELTSRALASAWLRHPWMTVGAFAAIHIEALKIWRKGARIRPRPPAPARRITAVGADAPAASGCGPAAYLPARPARDLGHPRFMQHSLRTAQEP